jgi:hypothetical protein
MRRRFGIFLFGVFLGVLFVRFAFPGRFTEYLQYFDLDYRVIYHLDQDTIYISSAAQCHLECLEKEQQDILQVLKNGQVNFDESQTKTSPCKTYTIENNDLSAVFELCDEKVKLQKFTLGDSTCSCYN